jgi:hypothetical protein
MSVLVDAFESAVIRWVQAAGSDEQQRLKIEKDKAKAALLAVLQ